MTRKPVLSRHRLPAPYRIVLVILWSLPVTLLLLTLVISRGIMPALLDPRLLLPLILMLVPALYIWKEGVDVFSDGLRIWIHWPRFRPYTDLDNWYFDKRPNRRVVTVWDCANRKILESHAAHLSNLPALLDALKAHVRPRNWPQ